MDAKSRASKEPDVSHLGIALAETSAAYCDASLCLRRMCAPFCDHNIISVGSCFWTSGKNLRGLFLFGYFVHFAVGKNDLSDPVHCAR